MLLSWTVGLAAWEVVGQISSPFVFASLTETLTALWDLLTSGTLLEAAGISLLELAIGFSIAALVGVAGGIAAGLSHTFRGMTEHWITMALATPFAAVFPVFLLWFGLGPASKVALALFAGFIPVWINTRAGIISVNPQLIEMAKVFRARWRDILGSVVLPWALPSMIEGLRMGLARAFLGVIVGELLASREGLGFLITLFSATLQVDALFATVLTVTLVTLGLTYLMRVAERAAVPWWSRQNRA